MPNAIVPIITNATRAPFKKMTPMRVPYSQEESETGRKMSTMMEGGMTKMFKPGGKPPTKMFKGKKQSYGM